jgi:pimeloyl-ACP methyl ester carboxylesterase
MPIFLLLAAVAFIGGGAWLYTPDKPRAALEAEYAGPPSEFLQVAGIRLHVRDTGPLDGKAQGDANAVILLHGLGSSLHTWEPWAQVLSAHFRVIRYDLPGFGLTGPDPTGDYTDARSVAVLAALMDKLSLPKASLIGNSMGGKLAWQFAAEHPDRVDKLVLISPDGYASPGFEYGKKPEVPTVAKMLPYTLPRWMLRMNLVPAYADKSRLTDATVARYRDMMLAPGVRRALLDRTAQVMLEPPDPMLRRIHAPTLLVWGEKDALIPFTNAQDYLKVIPNARLVSFPDLGHVPQEEDPARSLPPVEAFLNQ